MTNKLLIVEDEAVTRLKLAGYFEQAGYQVFEAENADQLRQIMKEHAIDLLLLDINLPGEDGLMLTRELRSQSEVGIILVTGRTDSIDKIVGLEMGADDYVTKPVELRELQVRVKNLLWRINLIKQATQLAPTANNLIQFGSYRLDTDRRQLFQNNQQIRLTKAEYELLLAFTSHTSTVLSRERLINLISHRTEAPSDRTIDVLVRRLRNKLEKDPANPMLFMTVHGEGYLFTGSDVA